MAITIQTAFTVTGAQAVTQATAQASSAFKGLQDQLKQTEQASTQATTAMSSGVRGMSQAFVDSTASIQAAIKANSAYAQSLASIAAAAANAQKQVSGSILGGRALGGAGAESVASLQAASRAGVAYQQSLVSINEATTQFARTQQTVQQQTQQTARQVQQSSQALTAMGGTLRSLASGFGVILGAQGIAALVKSVVEAGVQMERFERTLTAAVGSSRGAQQAFQFITAESNRLGQSVTEMVPIFVQLTAATRNTVLEGERTRELFSALAGAGQAVGLSTEAVGGAMLGLTQIISQNAIQLDEFRTQFASRIPGAMLETAKALKAMGVTQTGTIAEMLKGFERGRISVDQLTQAVTMGLREIQRTAPDMSNSVQAAFTSLSNAIFQLSADIARSGLLDLLARIARFASQEILGLGRALNIANIQDVDKLTRLREELTALQKLREQAAQQAAEPSLLGRVQGAIGTGPAQQLKDLDAERGRLEGEITRLQERVSAQQKADDENQRVRDERNREEKRQRDAADAAAAAARQGAQDAAARARAGVGLTQERVNQEKLALEQIQAIREQALERDYNAAVASTAQTKAAQEDLEKAFAIRRVDLAKQTALEDATLQERAAIQARDAKIAAIKAAEAAAAASAAAPGATAEAQATANQRSAASTLELQAVTLAAENAKAEAAKKRTDAEAEYEKKISAIVKGERADQVKVTEASLKREAEMRQQALQSQAGVLDAETALVQAQVEGLVITKEEGLARTQALEVQALENHRAQLEEAFQEELRQLQQRVDAHEVAESEITHLRETHQRDVQALNIQQQTLEQTHRNDLLQGWRAWARDVQGSVSGFLVDVFEKDIDSIKDGFDSLKSYFFKMIADMIAYAATNQIIVPIVGSLLGGLGGGGGGAVGAIGQALGVGGTLSALAGGGAGAGGGTGGGLDILGALGLASPLRNLLGPQGLFGNAVTFFTESLDTAANTIAGLFGSTAFPAGFVGPLPAGAAQVSSLGALGGLAGLGGGIYSALTSKNVGGMAGGAIGAAGGATALVTSLMPALMGGLSTVLGPIGLALSALAPLLGNYLGGLGAPKGPRFALGRVGGLGIGGGEGGLTVTGAATSQVLKQERLEGVNTAEVQAQLGAGVTTMVKGMVDAINAVALKPGALLQPTQKALSDALGNIQTINSSNAKKMEADIKDQLKFTSVSIASAFLRPLNEAFRQVESSELNEQLSRLPQTTTGMVDVFKKMNAEVDELSKSANTDVLRQLSRVRNRIEDFGNALADTARVISEDIVDTVIGNMSQQVDQTLSGQITQFAGLLNDSLGALAALRSTKGTLEGAGLEAGGVATQLDRLTTAIGAQAGRISSTMVETAMGDLAGQLDQLFTQPIAVQATVVNSLFNDSLAALKTLYDAWHAMEGAGLDASQVQAQFERLMGGVLNTTQKVLSNAFQTGAFSEFLTVLASIPEAVTNMNPAWAQLRQQAAAFAQVVMPIAQVIDATMTEMRTTGEQAAFTAQRIEDLKDAIADAGDAADRALPLYAQLAQAIQANAAAEIDVVNESAQAQEDVVNRRAETEIAAVNRIADARQAEIAVAVEQEVNRVNQWAEASQQVIDDWAQHGIDSINRWADESQRAVDEQAKSAIDATNRYANESQDAINRWADEGIRAVNEWADTTSKALNDWADAAQTTASQLADVNRSLLAEQNPAQQRETLMGQRRALEGLINTGGPGADRALTELIRVDQELLALAKQSDDLKLQYDMINELKSLQAYLIQRLGEQTGMTDPALAQIAVSERQEEILTQIRDNQQAELARIADWQEHELARIASEQQATLDQIASWQESEGKRIQEAQQSELKRIADWQERESKRITEIQTAELARIAQWQATEEAINTQWQTAEITRIQTAQQAELAQIKEWQRLTVEGIKGDMVRQLQDVSAMLRELFRVQVNIGALLSTPHQRGGIVGLASGLHYAQGGMVPVMLEPGERVFSGMNRMQMGALASMNREFPRFGGGGWMVPGSGVGDRIPAMVPSGSFILNRTAAGVRGFQGGGTVEGRGTSNHVNVHFDLRGAHFRSPMDAKEVIRIFDEYMKKRGNTRL